MQKGYLKMLFVRQLGKKMAVGMVVFKKKSLSRRFVAVIVESVAFALGWEKGKFGRRRGKWKI